MHTRTRSLRIRENDPRTMHLHCGTYRLPGMHVCIQINNMFAQNKTTLDLAEQGDPIALVVRSEMIGAVIGVCWAHSTLAFDCSWRDYGDWRDYGADILEELDDSEFSSEDLGADFGALWDAIRALFVTEPQVEKAEVFTEAS